MSSSSRKSTGTDQRATGIAALLQRAAQVHNDPSVAKSRDTVPYPTTNHKDLFISDPLNRTTAETVLSILTQDTSRGAFRNREERAQYEEYYQKFQHFLMTATRQNPLTKHEWEEYDSNVRVLILEHVRDSLRSSTGQLFKTEQALFTGQAPEGNALSTTSKASNASRIQSLVVRWMADNFFAPPEVPQGGEDTELQNQITLTLDLLGMTEKPALSGTGSAKYHTYSRKLLEVQQATVRIREYLNHSYCWFLYHVSHPSVQNEYKQVHRAFIAWKEEDMDAREGVLFTGKRIVNHIKQNLLEDNEALIRKLKYQLERIVRYHGESLIDWFDRIQALAAKLRKAMTPDQVSEDDERKIWKLTFVKNISAGERSIISQRAQELIDDDDYHFNASDWEQTKGYYTGTFPPTEFRNLLAILNSVASMKAWKPDVANRSYNNKRYKNLEAEPCYEDPEAGGKAPAKVSSKRPPNFLLEDEEDSGDDDQGIALVTSSTPKRPKKDVPVEWRCDNPMCVAKGNHRNHARKSYKGKEYPLCHFNNHNNRNDGNPRPIQNDFQRGKPKCWNCGSSEHLIRDCPKMSKVKDKLRGNSSFRTTARSLFTTRVERETVDRIVDAACTDRNVCLRCFKVDDKEDQYAGCTGTCTDTPQFLQEAEEARRKFFKHPELMQAIKKAQKGTATSVTGPMTAESFLAYDGGQVEDTVPSEPPSEPSSVFFQTHIQQDSNTCIDGSSNRVVDSRVEESEGQAFLAEPGRELFLTSAPRAPMGLETESRLYWELHAEEEGKPNWQRTLAEWSQSANLKASTERAGRVAKGKATFLMPRSQDTNAKRLQTREMYLDSCGSYPLIQGEELHDVRDCQDYGMPPLRFSTLESKTSWYDKVGIAIMKLENGSTIKFPAYSYSTKRAPKKENPTDLASTSFYLIDMSTILDFQIDLQYHMEASRKDEVRPVKLLTDRPDRFKAGGIRKNVMRGSRFSAAGERVKATAKEANRKMKLLGHKIRGARRDYLREKREHEVFLQECDEILRKGESCTCQVRVADSLSAEDYIRIQDDLQSLAIGSTPPPVLLNSSSGSSTWMESE